jgi:hypothetical protein
VPAEVGRLDREARAQAAGELRTAIAALGEVVKLIPAGEDRAPKSAFFSAEGRELYLADPGRFSRLRIGAVLEAWRGLAAQLE